MVDSCDGVDSIKIVEGVVGVDNVDTVVMNGFLIIIHHQIFHVAPPNNNEQSICPNMINPQAFNILKQPTVFPNICRHR